ncbi:uncharacterized protein VTP21DRAFT_4424 [Calcarisporiella thermophila]|uniref:uncharacterized protein n=1 Tax=Calcarisporiella thermophila TaxID=911321 RepID=UPI003742FFA6
MSDMIWPAEDAWFSQMPTLSPLDSPLSEVEEVSPLLTPELPCNLDFSLFTHLLEKPSFPIPDQEAIPIVPSCLSMPTPPPADAPNQHYDFAALAMMPPHAQAPPQEMPQPILMNPAHLPPVPFRIPCHALDRQFKCDKCPQAFHRNHDLKRHKRIHLDHKPFSCTACKKQFSRKDALKRHVLVKKCGQLPPRENAKKN